MSYAAYLLGQIFRRRFLSHTLSGAEKSSGAPLTVRYMGEGRSLGYLKTLLFREPPEDAVRARYSLLQLAGRALPALDGCDLEVCELTPRILRLMRPGGSLKIPDWVEQEIMLNGTWEDVIARFRKNTRATDLRKVRKYGFTHDVVNDRESIEYFYDKLYAPYLTRRFRDLVDLVDRDWLIAVAQHDGLLRILDGERVVAGVVFHDAGGYLDWIWTGALPGEGAEIEDGAFSSLYYHSIKYAHDRGFSRMRMNNSRPFLMDGVHRYKRKWGTRIAPSRQPGTKLLLDFDPSSRAAQRWLESSPFLAERHGRLRAQLFCFTEGVDGEQLACRIRDVVSPGIDGVDVHAAEPPRGLPARVDACPVRWVALGGQPAAPPGRVPG